MTDTIGPLIICGKLEGEMTKISRDFKSVGVHQKLTNLQQPLWQEKKEGLESICLHLWAVCHSGICKQREMKFITRYTYTKYSQKEGDHDYF